MLKGICITGLDGNFATKADIHPVEGSQTQLMLEFEDQDKCAQFLNRNKNKLYQMSIGVPQEEPKTFTHRLVNYEQLETREFSFGQRTPPEEAEEADGDSGGSPSLNVFYARPEVIFNTRPQISIATVKEENIHQEI